MKCVLVAHSNGGRVTPIGTQKGPNHSNRELYVALYFGSILNRLLSCNRSNIAIEVHAPDDTFRMLVLSSHVISHNAYAKGQSSYHACKSLLSDRSLDYF